MTTNICVKMIFHFLKNILNNYSNKKAHEIREIILAELRNGDFSRVDKDELIAISYRTNRDIAEGIAKNNLRLLARLMCGLSECKEFKFENFKKYERILVDLSENEIFLLSKIIKHYREGNDNLLSSCIDRALVEMCGIPENCNKEKYNKCMEIFSALERTGLIVKQGKTEEAIQTGGLYHSPYSITNFMKEMIKFFPNWLDSAKDFVD